ncbi:hypothetical protein M569_13369 [Genlisea aurea]|uniref:Uncharacterized protein n=1 Tax=Genlisea aurea TaxID=192259 RepID=S8DF85_9LAMI|nr:hypothetical protein M569_13369 [Genlisea aurea]
MDKIFNFSTREWWNWPCQNSALEYNTEGIPEGATNSMFDDTKTPIKACCDLPHRVISKDFRGKEEEEEEEEPPYCSHVKRRRVLHLEPEFLDPSPSNDDIFLRSKEKMDCIEDDLTEWVAGFTECSNDELLPDPSSEGWISSCFNDDDLQISAQDL